MSNEQKYRPLYFVASKIILSLYYEVTFTVYKMTSILSENKAATLNLKLMYILRTDCNHWWRN